MISGLASRGSHRFLEGAADADADADAIINFYKVELELIRNSNSVQRWLFIRLLVDEVFISMGRAAFIIIWAYFSKHLFSLTSGPGVCLRFSFMAIFY